MLSKVNKIEPGTIVRHFKHDFLSYEDRKNRLKDYVILGYGIDTETGKDVVIYKAISGDFTTFVRPADSFYSKVDKRKYPKAIQEHRFEKIEEEL